MMMVRMVFVLISLIYVVICCGGNWCSYVNSSFIVVIKLLKYVSSVGLNRLMCWYYVIVVMFV